MACVATVCLLNGQRTKGAVSRKSKVLADQKHEYQVPYGDSTWKKSSSGNRRQPIAIHLLFLTITCLSASVARAQGGSEPTHDTVKSFLGPVIDTVTWPFFAIYWLLWSIAAFPGVAILASAASAALFAVLAMLRQARTARLRETFTTLNRDNWDRDVIHARETLRQICNELGDQPGSISKYAGKATEVEADTEIESRLGRGTRPPSEGT